VSSRRKKSQGSRLHRSDDEVDVLIRRRVKRFFASSIAAAVERSPRLEQVLSAAAEGRRLQIALARLRRRGLHIEVVYDIGAHRGQWTESVRASLPGARFFLFEANEVHAGELQGTGERYFIAVLSAEEQVVNFYGTGEPGDSYFREATDHYSDVTPTSLQATTLDNLVAINGLPLPDFVKVDVQGAELDVLRGAKTALHTAKLVLLECPITEYNEGAPTIDEYFHFMDERGFTPLEFLGRNWRRGKMMHVDVLFASVSATHAFASPR
jgi:FkbM family methyltransferase